MRILQFHTKYSKYYNFKTLIKRNCWSHEKKWKYRSDMGYNSNSVYCTCLVSVKLNEKNLKIEARETNLNIVQLEGK